MELKKFDVEKAKAGAKVVTRSGKNVRLVCYDLKPGDNYPLLGLVEEADGREFTHVFTLEGKVYNNKQESIYDLFLLPDTKKAWVNIYKVADAFMGAVTKHFTHFSEEAAFEALNYGFEGNGMRYLKTAVYEWEE